MGEKHVDHRIEELATEEISELDLESVVGGIARFRKGSDGKLMDGVVDREKSPLLPKKKKS